MAIIDEQVTWFRRAGAASRVECQRLGGLITGQKADLISLLLIGVL